LEGTLGFYVEVSLRHLVSIIIVSVCVEGARAGRAARRSGYKAVFPPFLFSF
jgi:hypothetical protein